MLSGWTTLRAAATVTSIRQSGAQWLDVESADDLVGWLEVKNFDNGTPPQPLTFAYQFSPTRDEAYFVDTATTRVSVTGAGITITKLLNVADVYGARYLRYLVSSGSGTAWDLTFRCWVAASVRLRRKKAARLVVARTPAVGASVSPGGDVAGTATMQTVVGLDGVPLDASMAQPKRGQVITLGKNGKWMAQTPPAPFRAGGDLMGTPTLQTIAKLDGVSLDPSMGSPADGQVITLSGGSWVPATPAAAFTAGGDLTGTATSQSVAKLDGVALDGSMASPAVGQVVTLNSAGHWAPATPAAGFSAGGDLTGTATSQTVAKFNGVSLASGMASPSAGQVITYSGGNWTPVTPSPATLYGTYASRPAANTVVAGTRYVCSDGIVEFVSDASAWRPLIQGVLAREIAPGNSLSAWTHVGTTLTTVNVVAGCPYLYASNNGGFSNATGYEQTRSGTQSFVVHLKRQPRLTPTSQTAVDHGRSAVWVRDASSGKLICWMVGVEGGGTNTTLQLIAYNMPSLTNWAATPYLNAIPFDPSAGVWMRIRPTGSTIVFGISVDGRNWLEPYTDSTTYLGTSNMGNRFGFGFNNGYDSGATFLSAEIA